MLVAEQTEELAQSNVCCFLRWARRGGAEVLLTSCSRERANTCIWHAGRGASGTLQQAVRRVKSKQMCEQEKPAYCCGECQPGAIQAMFPPIKQERYKYSARSLRYFNQMESKMFGKLKIHLFLQSCIPSVFRHLWNLFAYRIWQPLVPWKYFFPMELTESQAGCTRHWSTPVFQVLSFFSKI